MRTLKLFYLGMLSMTLIFTVGCSKEETGMEEVNAVNAHIEPNELANNGSKAKMYTVEFGSLNESGVSGTAELSLTGSTLTVNISASGLEANQVHPQHIHGFSSNKGNSTCPPASADQDGDGYVSIPEGAPFYGGVLLTLGPIPTADANGNINFTMTYEYEDGIDSDITPLQNRAIVLHGMTVDGEYWAGLPVACGQIMPSQGSK
ncbi:hypothetical protein [Christiangramia aestuarii]|nr:hypothetical protein [Christiangramia aestuarii]